MIERGRGVIEVWDGDELIAAIYPGADRALKIVTKFPLAVRLDDSADPAAAIIEIGTVAI